MKKIILSILLLVGIISVGHINVFADTINYTDIETVDANDIIAHTDLGATPQNVAEVDFYVNGIFNTSKLADQLYVPTKFDTTLNGLNSDTDYDVTVQYLNLAGNQLWSEDLGVSHTGLIQSVDGLPEDNNDPNPPSDTTVHSPDSNYRQPLSGIWDYYPMQSYSFKADSTQMGGTYTDQWTPIFYFSGNPSMRITVKGNVIQKYLSAWGANTEVLLYEDDGIFGKTLVKYWLVKAAIYDQYLDVPYASTWEDGLDGKAEFKILVRQHYQTTTNKINLNVYSGVE